MQRLPYYLKLYPVLIRSTSPALFYKRATAPFRKLQDSLYFKLRRRKVLKFECGPYFKSSTILANKEIINLALPFLFPDNLFTPENLL